MFQECTDTFRTTQERRLMSRRRPTLPTSAQSLCQRCTSSQSPQFPAYRNRSSHHGANRGSKQRPRNSHTSDLIQTVSSPFVSSQCMQRSQARRTEKDVAILPEAREKGWGGVLMPDSTSGCSNCGIWWEDGMSRALTQLSVRLQYPYNTLGVQCTCHV